MGKLITVCPHQSFRCGTLTFCLAQRLLVISGMYYVCKVLNKCCLDMNLFDHYACVCVCRYDVPGEELLSSRGGVVGSQVQPDDVSGRGFLWRWLRSLSPHLWGTVSGSWCDKSLLIQQVFDIANWVSCLIQNCGNQLHIRDKYLTYNNFSFI